MIKNNAHLLNAEQIRELAEGLARDARRWSFTAEELARGALELRETAEGWRLVFQRAHYARGAGRAVARYKIPAELAGRASDRALALAIWAALMMAGSARAINSNAGRSQEARKKAAKIAVKARKSGI